MKRLLAAAAVILGLASAPAHAAFNWQSCSLVITEQASVIQYRDGSGNLHAGVVTAITNGSPLQVSLFYFASGTLNLATSVGQDQSQSTNNTFAVISCATPF